MLMSSLIPSTAKGLWGWHQKAGIQSIAFPKLGAQNGKLSWDDVGPLMAKYLSHIDIDVYIYIGEGDKEYQYDTELVS